jgi:putative ABC transport system substrate-binding protein
MRRRDFIKATAGWAASWPLAVHAQQQPMPLVGFLHSGSAGPFASEKSAFVQGLNEAGYVEGQNVLIEYRWAEGQSDRLPALAADLVSREVTVLAAIGGDVVALAAKAATATIPVVFLNGSDPINAGLVSSINRPGGNITGVSLFAGTVDAKRLELLRQLVPKATTVAVFNNALVAETEARSKSLVDAAKTLGLQLTFFDVSSENSFDSAFATMADRKIGGLFVSGSPFFVSRRDQLIPLAARYAVPTMYAWRVIAAAGGLMSYGADLADSARQVGVYVGRILKGEKVAELPVLQPTKFELVINLKTAKALGITVPPTLLALADEVIE